MLTHRGALLRELPVPQMVWSLGSGGREEPSARGQPLEAALGGSCSGRGSSFKFHGALVPTTQVKSRDGNTMKKAGGWKSDPQRGCEWEGHSGLRCWRCLDLDGSTEESLLNDSYIFIHVIYFSVCM